MNFNVNVNLLISEFVTGGYSTYLDKKCSKCDFVPKGDFDFVRVTNVFECKEDVCPKKELLKSLKIKEVEALHRWEFFNKNDYTMSRRSTERINYLHLIPLNTLKIILNDLHEIFIKHYPFSTLEDFKSMVLETTIFDLKDLIEWNEANQLVWMAEPPNENDYTYYSVFQPDTKENIDFGIDSQFDIDYYIQYFKRVLELIEDFNNDEPQSIIESKTPFTDSKTDELFNYILKNWSYHKDLKYAYIYNYMLDTLGCAIIQTDYEKFIRTKYDVSRVYFLNANSKKLLDQIEIIVDNYKQ
jgi:hypothetical protein